MNERAHQLIQRLWDKTISADEFEELNAMMLADPQVRDLYYEYVSLEQGLKFHLSNASHKPGIPGLASFLLAMQSRRNRKIAMVSALAAMIVLGFALSLFFIDRSVDQINYKVTPGTIVQFSSSDERQTGEPGVFMVGTTMVISQGVVELDFESGVKSVVSGPAKLTLYAEDRLAMDYGTGWFRVPKEAVGFAVTTKELEVIDLGTEFGVISDLNEPDQVHVLDGSVKVKSLRGQRQELVLVRDQAVSVYPVGSFENLPAEDKYFLTSLPVVLPHLHFSFDQANDFVASNTIIGLKDFDYDYHGDRPVLENGVFGEAIHLNGKNNYLETNWPGILSNDPRSVALWMKMPKKRLVDEDADHFGDTIVGWGMQRDRNSFEAGIHSKWTLHMDYRRDRSPFLNISFGGVWYYADDIVLDNDQWNHIVVTYSGEKNKDGFPLVKLYLNAELIDVHPVRGAYVKPVSEQEVLIRTLEKTPVVMGATLSSESELNVREGMYLGAMIDELFIIEGVIGPEEVKSLMDSNKLP
ncbi:hypothetical protein Rhal01_00657 [Rubritalea halochordaticola]|uniref:FecR protein domain-containing protein n=1 Tax=Rubritalea halochordaticola TaxID=714537 RepID=A0ABP9V083_9BACT